MSKSNRQLSRGREPRRPRSPGIWRARGSGRPRRAVPARPARTSRCGPGRLDAGRVGVAEAGRQQRHPGRDLTAVPAQPSKLVRTAKQCRKPCGRGRQVSRAWPASLATVWPTVPSEPQGRTLVATNNHGTVPGSPTCPGHCRPTRGHRRTLARHSHEYPRALRRTRPIAQDPPSRRRPRVRLGLGTAEHGAQTQNSLIPSPSSAAVREDRDRQMASVPRWPCGCLRQAAAEAQPRNPTCR